MLGSLVFFGASLYGDEIRSAFPFYWGPPVGGFVFPAILFWAGVVVVTGMLAFKNKIDDDARMALVTATERA